MNDSTSSMRSLVRTTGAYTSVTLLRAILMVAVLPLLTRLLPVTEYALIALLTPVWWIGQSVLSLGTSEGIARVVTGRTRDVAAGTYLGCVAIVSLMSALAFSVAPAASGPLLGVPWSGLVLFTLALAALQSLVSVSAAALRGQRRVSAATIVMGTAAIGAPASGLAGAAITHSATGYTAGMSAAVAAAVLIGTGFLVFGAHLDLATGVTTSASCARLGLPALPQAGALLILDAALRRVVLEGHGFEELAVYGLAASTGGLLWTVVRSASLAWGPEIYSYNDEEVEPNVRAQVRVFVAATTVCAGIGVAVAPFAAHLLVPDTYPISHFTPLVAVLTLSGVVGVPFMALFQLCYRDRATTALPLATVPVVAVVVAAAWQWRTVLSVELVAAGQPLALGLIAVALWAVVRHRSSVSVSPSLWWIPVGSLALVATIIGLDDSPVVGAILGAGLVLLGATLARQVLVGRRMHG